MCPFCRTTQRRAGAPVWAAALLVGGLGLGDGGCDDGQDGTVKLREQQGTETGMATGGGTTEVDTVGSGMASETGAESESGTTLDEWSSSGTASTSGSSGTGSSETGSSGTGSTGAGSDGGSTTWVTASADDGDYPDASTYAGPDEDWPTSYDPDEDETTGGSTTEGEAADADTDAFTCSVRSGAGGGWLGLFALAAIRRRRAGARGGSG